MASMQEYLVTVQFDAVDITVKAKNKREAMRKVRDKLKRTRAYRYLDKQNYFVDRVR